MKSINVSSNNSEEATGVWYEAPTGRLCVLFGSILRAIRLDLVPASDFDSEGEITRFSLGQHGSVVVCHHVDGKETWLPVDMWWPGGFTPPRPKARGRQRSVSPRTFAAELIRMREQAGLNQKDAAEIGGVPKRTLQQWEQGRQSPAKDRANAILRTLQESLVGKTGAIRPRSSARA